MAAAQRLVLLVDWQNVYRGCRETFDLRRKFHTAGQVDPVMLGQRIAEKYVPGVKREFAQVRVYSGRPDPRLDAKTYAAHMRQCAMWEKSGIVVLRTRQLRYPREWPELSAEEKGIDVQLAIDFVMGTLRKEFDVGVVFSTDTDLLPALEGAAEIARTQGTPLPEVAAWREKDGRGRRRLNIAGLPLRCHWLDWADYMACQDRTDFNIGQAPQHG